jgi:ADP-ribosylglycohydrolase
MRMAPVGFAVDADSAYSLGCELSGLTHGHPTAVIAGGYFARLIALLSAGRPLESAVEEARDPLANESSADEVLTAIDRARALAAQTTEPTPEQIETLGGGWTAEEALSIALAVALVARDFEHGLRLAVNHSGDSDSTGSLVGNLLGVCWGAESIPERWLQELELSGVIEQVALDLTALVEARFDPEKEWDRYPGW